MELGAIIKLSKDKGKKEEIREECNYIHGCSSSLWLSSNISEKGKMVLDVDSDSLITRGIALLIIIKVYEMSPEEILTKNIDVTDISELLSISRRNGISLLLKEIFSRCKEYV